MIDVAKRNASLRLGINEPRKSITTQRAHVMPPPVSLFVFIVITSLQSYLQPIHGMMLPPHISQQQSAHIRP